MEDTTAPTAFLALYAGNKVHEARVVAISCDPSIVGRFMDLLPAETAEVPRRPHLSLVPEPVPDDAA